MKIRVSAELVYRFDPPTDAIYKIQVAHWPGQTILEESLTTTPACGRTTPPTSESSVVLPLPLAPRRKTRSPGAIASWSMARQSRAAPGQR